MSAGSGCRDPMYLSLRVAREEDEAFLYQLYASARQEEMAAWGWDSAHQDSFLRMQFRAQRQGYAAQYPDADHRLILADEKPVGRMIVHRTEKEIRLIDIAILSENRNHGLGTAVVRGLIAECQASGAPLQLQVAKGNRAIHLYQRLGFSVRSEDEVFYAMSWDPATNPAATNLAAPA
jgi:ribosomal protein S18 acetylase RimI-like enzyme